MRTLAPFAAAVLIACVAHPARAGVIKIDDVTLELLAVDGSAQRPDGTSGFVGQSVTDTETSISRHETLFAGAGQSLSSVDLDFTRVGGVTTLNYNLTQMRAGDTGSRATFTYEAIFTARADVTYALSGQYAETFGGGSVKVQLDELQLDANGNLQLDANNKLLLDEYGNPFGVILFSCLGTAANFNLGTPGASGDFFKDRKYRLLINTIVEHSGSTPDHPGAQAAGQFSMTVTGTPEPSSMAMLGLAGIAGIGARWRRRSTRRDCRQSVTD